MAKSRPKTPRAAPPRRRRCTECEELKFEVIGGLCEGCEEDKVYCTVCKRFYPRDDECRHLTWTDCGFTGAGGDDGLDPAEMHKKGVLAFFDLLDTLRDEYGDNLARSADREIRRHRFFTQMRGGLLSVPDMHLCRLRFDLHKDTRWLDFGTVRDTDFTEEREWAGCGDGAGRVAKDGFDASLLTEGYGWLSTLDANKTRAANRLTAAWLDAWWAERDAGRRPLPAGRERVPFLESRPWNRRERLPPWVAAARKKKRAAARKAAAAKT